MKTLALSALAVSAAVTLFVAPAYAGRVIAVLGSGNSSGSDRAAADAEAFDQATTQANSLCIGTVVSTAKTMDNCIKVGSGDDASYVCTVMVRAMCELPGR